MKILLLENVTRQVHGIDTDFGNYLAANATVCFYSQSHLNGVQMPVETDNEKLTVSVTWRKSISPEVLKSYRDENECTNYGAMCVAILMALEFTDFKSFERSQVGSGVDFWVSKEANDLSFSARMEVSGIRRESGTNTLENRLKEKKEQSRKSDSTKLPAYIAVIEFSHPKAIFVKK